MTLEELYNHYGTPAEARVAIHVSRSCFSMWRKRGFIPPLAQMRIERLTQGELKADDMPIKTPETVFDDTDYFFEIGNFMQITEEDKKKVRNYLKNRFKILRNIIETLERDIRSPDDQVQATAIYISGQFLAMSTAFFGEMNKKGEESNEKGE